VEQIDVVDLLKTSGDQPRPRMPRVEVECVCFVREGAIVHRTLLHNISQGGLSVESTNPLTIGSDVAVSLAGMPPQQASVRWGNGHRYGISFNSVLPLAGLVTWLQARSAR
jgi:hypothetical protein